MKIQRTIYILFALSVLAIFSGCMTPVTVQTDPPGAQVYCRGWGRPSYKWKLRGRTEKDKPVSFRVPYNTIRTFAVWDGTDGKSRTRSEVVETRLLFNDDPVIKLTPMAR
jgi:hypothetical protein